MDAPDARAAFLEAVLGDASFDSGTPRANGVASAPADGHGSGYSHEQMLDPTQYVPLLARAFPLYVRSLKVSESADNTSLRA